MDRTKHNWLYACRLISAAPLEGPAIMENQKLGRRTGSVSKSVLASSEPRAPLLLYIGLAVDVMGAGKPEKPQTAIGLLPNKAPG